MADNDGETTIMYSETNAILGEIFYGMSHKFFPDVFINTVFLC